MMPDSLKSYVYHEEPGIVLLHGDCLELLPMLAPESVQCCVTSPPYWGLRDYGVDGQLGLEESPQAYTERMTEVFKGVMGAMRPDGTLWLSLGDTYNGNKKGNTETIKNPNCSDKQDFNKKMWNGCKQKDLIGIPWRTAFALQSDGWYLRSDIIWSKPNPMPESVTDRPTKAHEYIFLMSKEAKYYYDHEAIKEPANYDGRNDTMLKGSDKYKESVMPGGTPHTMAARGHERWKWRDGEAVKNKRSVWNVATRSYPGAHFAVFPPELIEPCILAGTKEGDIVLDPFNGSGTVGHVCKKHKRRYIGIELNEEYLKLNPDRIGRQGILI